MVRQKETHPRESLVSQPGLLNKLLTTDRHLAKEQDGCPLASICVHQAYSHACTHTGHNIIGRKAGSRENQGKSLLSTLMVLQQHLEMDLISAN